MALPKSRWPLPAVPLLIAGMIVYGSGTPVSKLVGQSFPPELAGGLRMVLASALLLPPASAGCRPAYRPASWA